MRWGRCSKDSYGNPIEKKKIKAALSWANRVYLIGKAHIGFAGLIGELETHPEVREKYLEV